MIFTLQIFSRLYFHHAGMTLPGAGFGLRVQGPNVQRMVVSALASTGPSFGWGENGLR